jgi:Xaa-Pro aminopeptidase
MKYRYLIGLLLIQFANVHYLSAQDKVRYQADFTVQDFGERREKVFQSIGKDAIALIQGASGLAGFNGFRQSNSFYYLCGLEAAQAYLLLNGKNKRATLYLPHRDEGRERGEGKVLSAEDADLVQELTGVDRVRGLEFLSLDLVGTGLIKPPAPVLYTLLSPAETGADSRDELLFGQARISSDPWDGRPSREAHLIHLINQRFPQFEVRDLSPILDSMRLIKSQKEIELIRMATQIAGLGIIEAMRSTSPGVYEYQLDAAAKYIFYLNGSQGEGYASIIGGGTNAYMGHYFHKTDVLKDGDLVLMDFAPDYKYYTSDVTRIWPVNGKFNAEQRELYNFIVAYRDALFRYIKPGTTSTIVLEKAAEDMKKYLVDKKFLKPSHLKAVEEGLRFRGHFQHPVGMAVHDVGRVRNVELQPGMVFTIDPMIWIRDERLYIRIEDVAVVTEDGVENLSAFVPSSIKDVEQTMKEKGLIQYRPPTVLPLNK